MFKSNLSKYEFSVFFEILKSFNLVSIEKRIYVKNFINDFPSTLSNQTIRQIKMIFLDAIQILENNKVIESRFKILRHRKLESVKKLSTNTILRDL